MNDLKKIILEAPDTQLDAAVKATVQEWSDEPTAIQILKSIDFAVYGGGASGFCMTLFESLLSVALETEGIDYETAVAGAVWRDAQYK